MPLISVIFLCKSFTMSVTNSNPDTTDQTNDWILVSEFINRFPGNISGASVRRWCQKGIIKGAIKLPTGRWRIPTSAIDQLYAESQTW